MRVPVQILTVSGLPGSATGAAASNPALDSSASICSSEKPRRAWACWLRSSSRSCAAKSTTAIRACSRATRAAYAAAVGLPLYTGPDIPAETIHVANSDRLTEGYFSQPLTEVAVGGWNTQDVTAEVDHLCGTPIRVNRRFEYHAWDNAEAFASDADDTRSIGSDFKEVRLTATKTQAKTLNRGLIIRIDKDEVDDMAQAEVQRVGYLTQRLRLNQFRRVFALLSAAATNTARTWLSGTRDADLDIMTAVHAYHTAVGVYPNTVVSGKTAWLGRLTTMRALATAAGFASSAWDEKALAAFLGVDEVGRVNATYQSGAAAKTVIGASIVLVHLRAQTQMREDPSNLKYFWTPTESGGPVSAFRYEVGRKKVVVGVEHNELLTATYTGGIQTLTIS